MEFRAIITAGIWKPRHIEKTPKPFEIKGFEQRIILRQFYQNHRRIMVRVTRLERAISASQMRRGTNSATPGYSISAIIPRQGGKSKIFLSVVIYVVKTTFVSLSAIGESPANAGTSRLCGVSPCSVPDTATALPNHPRYQLRYTRI